jgi:hypothetical protein
MSDRTQPPTPDVTSERGFIVRPPASLLKQPPTFANHAYVGGMDPDAVEFTFFYIPELPGTDGPDLSAVEPRPDEPADVLVADPVARVVIPLTQAIRIATTILHEATSRIGSTNGAIADLMARLAEATDEVEETT